MPFWKIHSEDIINNTGITLANPTGVAGTYALAKDVVAQTVWYVDGVLWTGAVVTVGPGKDYETPVAAVNAASGDTLFLIYPGITDRENIVIRTPSKRYFRGMGASPEDVTIPACVYFYDSPYGYLRDVNLIFENLVLLGVTNDWTINLNYQSSYLSYITGTMRFNKCDIYGRSCFGASWGLADENTFKVYLSYTRLYATWRHLVYMYLNNFYLDKVSYNGTWTTAYCYDSIPPAQDDKAVDGTEGYGYNYGTSSIITSAEVIQRHDLSWGGGTAQSVTEDGVYTLSDGSNNQKLILNFDGAEGATTYINDVTGEAIEPPYQEGCSIDTSWKKFGAGSLKVTAGSTLSLVLPSSNAGDITLHGVLKVVQELSVGNSPFCIELFSELTGDFLAFLRFNFDTDGPLGGGAICYFSYYDSANETYHDSDYFKGLAVGSESHIAMVIDGATVRGFVDGTKVWEYTHTGLITEFSMFDLWLVDGGQVNIDAVEITHEALWAENFTPPTSAPSAESGNTIEATVDYSALSAEDEADNVRVFEELLSISVNPPSKYIRPGDALQYSVIGNYELGVTRDITSQVTDWESSDTSIATMLSSGIAKAVATGKTTIKAVLGALSDTVLLMVRSVLPRPPQIVAFSSQKAYRSAEYLTKRFKFPKTSLSLVKVIASAYPVELDVVYPKLSKTLTVVVTSKRPKRIKSFLVDCCEVRIRTNSQVSAVFLASSMDELPL